MSNKTYIVSDRSQVDFHAFHLIYEWEDEMVGALPEYYLWPKKELVIKGKPLIKGEQIILSYGIPILKLVEKFTSFNIDRLLIGKSNKVFRFEMSPRFRNNAWNQGNVSIVIVDFYLPKSKLKAFYDSYSNVGHLYVSSMQVFKFLKDNNPPRLIKHCPLSLPDRYAIKSDTHFEKKYDLVLIGRQNPVLEGFLKKYEQSHEITYVYKKKGKDGQFACYTNKGDSVTPPVTRDEYMNLMKQGKVALYSASGIDNDRAETNGFHQVTPRFLEAIACGCHVLSRFEDNEDTDFYDLRNMSFKIDNYADFEIAMDKALSSPVDMKKYAQYLEEHYTSAVCARYL